MTTLILYNILYNIHYVLYIVLTAWLYYYILYYYILYNGNQERSPSSLTHQPPLLYTVYYTPKYYIPPSQSGSTTITTLYIQFF